MVSLNGPRPDPEGQRGGTSPSDRGQVFRSSFAALVEVVYDPSLRGEVEQRAGQFCREALQHLREGHLPPEDVLLTLKLKDPHTGSYVFAELGLLPHTLGVVCGVVTDHVAQGKAVSSAAVSRLGWFAAAPDLVGVPGSLNAYRAMVVGATHFYQTSDADKGDEWLRVNPTGLFATLMTNLHKCSEPHPDIVARVVRALGSIPLAPPLLDGLDSLLVNTVHPARTSIPAVVREAAIHALADRIRRPPLRFACEEGAGGVDRHAACQLLSAVLRQRSEPGVIGAAFQRLGEMLGDEARTMLEAKEGLAGSSFLQAKNSESSTQTVIDAWHRAEGIVAGCGDELTHRLAYLRAFQEAERVDTGLRFHRLSRQLRKYTPSSLHTAIEGILHWGYRYVDRLTNGAADTAA